MTDPYYYTPSTGNSGTGSTKRRTNNFLGAKKIIPSQPQVADNVSIPYSSQSNISSNEKAGSNDWFVYEQQTNQITTVPSMNQSSGMGYYGNESSGWSEDNVNGSFGTNPPLQPYMDYHSTPASQVFYASPSSDFNYGGSYEYGAPQQTPSQNFFIPSTFLPGPDDIAPQGFGGDDIENEPPLLEELGINFDHIRQKTFAVLNPVSNAASDVIKDADLAGPIVFCLLFGVSLLLHGKIHFGNIYGIGVLGCLGMYGLLNMMAEESRTISLTNTVSVLGYCLLPLSLLSLVAAVLSLQGVGGYILALCATFWSGFTSSKLFTQALEMHDQRILVAYPCTLLYVAFALLAIF